MEMKRDLGFGNSSTGYGDNKLTVGNNFTFYSADQVKILEQLFVESQKPSHTMRLAMIRENPVLSDLDSQQIQAWFEYHRFGEKKKKDAFVLDLLREKVAAIRRLLLLQNEYLHGEVQQCERENEYLRRLLQHASLVSFLGPVVPRSVYRNVKMVAVRMLLLLQTDCLRNEVQQLQREKKYLLNLLQNVSTTHSDFVANSYPYLSEAADSSKGLLLLYGTLNKFSLETPGAHDWASISRMKFSEGVKEITLNTCPDLTYFPFNNIIITGPLDLNLSFLKEAAVPNRPLDLLLHKHQEFIVCCLLKDIKMDQISFRDGDKSLTTIVPAFLPLDTKLNLILFMEGQESLTVVIYALLPQGFRVVLGRYQVSCRYS